MAFFKKMFKGSEEDKSDKKIKKELQKESKQRTISALLLGPGGSGKSTILKQMEKIHNGIIGDHEMTKAVDDIRNNIVCDICDICDTYIQLSKDEDELKLKDCGLENEEKNLEIVERFASLGDDGVFDEVPLLTPDMATMIAQIWSDPGMKKTLQYRAKSHVMDNTPWMLDRVDTIADPNYQGSFDAYVRVRDRTTGIINRKFLIDINGKQWVFGITDVGGQRCERKKWFQLFQDVNVVLYVMSMSSYDQVLFEANSVKCYDESFDVFQETSRNKAFQSTDFVVFLNKVDVFDAKIDGSPFTLYDPKFPEEHSKNRVEIVHYIQSRFTKLFEESNKALIDELFTKTGQKPEDVFPPIELARGVYFHVTCATDTKQVERVIQDVQMGMVQRTLRAVSLT